MTADATAGALPASSRRVSAPAPSWTDDSSSFRQRPEARATGLWDTRDVTRVAATAGLGLVGMVVCWQGGSGELTLDDSLPWLVGSMASLAVLVIGLVVWLLSGFRTFRLAEHETARALLSVLDELALPDVTVAVPQQGGERLLAVPGTTHYHRSGCPAVMGKDRAEVLSEQDVAVRTDLRPCGMCMPT